jgi:chloride channel protein, CIC family
VKINQTKQTSKEKRLITLCWVTIVIGIVSGSIGMFLVLLLKAIQHLSYGHSPLEIISHKTFLEIVYAASPLRRLVVLSVCGLIAGCGWWALHAYGKSLVSIASAVTMNKTMPRVTTIIHALLQIITVGMGSPLGRERAPREVGVVFAKWLSVKARLSTRDTKIMVACGAGAAFGAIYNVPFAGALYVLEVLLFTMNWSVLIPAIASSVIAVLISWIGLGTASQYHLVNHDFSQDILFFSALTGPIFGVFAYWFMRFANHASNAAPVDWKLPTFSLVNFMMIGLLAIYLPALLGNGKSPVQLEFDDAIGIGLSFILLIFRVLITLTTLRTGSYGGLLTPCLAIGALFGVVLGGCWNFLWPGTSLNEFALVGASAFLASAQKMPITAIILMFELTHMKFSFLMPILLAVTGSFCFFRLCVKCFDEKCKKPLA